MYPRRVQMFWGWTSRSFFYLNTLIYFRECLRAKIENFPEDMIVQDNLRDAEDNKDLLMIRAKKGMYGLPYAGIMVQNLP